MRRIGIQIDTIVVDGIEVGDPQAFQTAVADGLAEHAGLHDGDYPYGTASTLYGSDIRSCDSDQLGRAVAQSAWASMIAHGAAPARWASATPTTASASADGGGP